MPELKIAVIGAGPAGMFAADELLVRLPGTFVDVIDRLPTPWGLVRHGIAPDHQKMKAVTKVFERTFTRPGIRFLGGLEVGRQVSHDELLSYYDALVYCTGAPEPRRLQVGGSDLDGVTTAGEFVAWYNGHPDASDLPIVLDTTSASIVGVGNAALDCARLLLIDADELATTDIADHALEAFRSSQVTDVIMIGRRGPDTCSMSGSILADALRTLDVDLVVTGTALDGDDEISVVLRSHLERRSAGRRRSLRRLHIAFNARPTSYVGSSNICGVRLTETSPEAPSRSIEIPCSLLIEAVGFAGTPLDGLPYAEETSTIKSGGGRVGPRVYVAGWAKRGATGVVGINKKCARETVEAIVSDIRDGSLAAADRDGHPSWSAGSVTLAGWRMIDDHELAVGASSGRPRVKTVRLDQQLALASSSGNVCHPRGSLAKGK
jgi:ferredoxin--NADP+ reductase